MALNDFAHFEQISLKLNRLQRFFTQVHRLDPDMLPESNAHLTDARIIEIVRAVLTQSGLEEFLLSSTSSLADPWEEFLFAVHKDEHERALEELKETGFRQLEELVLYPLRYHEEVLSEALFGNAEWSLLYEVLGVNYRHYGWDEVDAWDEVSFDAPHVLAASLQSLMDIEAGMQAALSDEWPDILPLAAGLTLRYGTSGNYDPFIGHMYFEDEPAYFGWEDIPVLLAAWKRWQCLERQAPSESAPLTCSWLFGQTIQWMQLNGENHD